MGRKIDENLKSLAVLPAIFFQYFFVRFFRPLFSSAIFVRY